MLKDYFVDLHVHIGRDSHGRPVKVSGAQSLTFGNIAREAGVRKGIEVVGIIDCASRRVMADIQAMLDSGDMCEAPGGGLRYIDKTTVILGAEVEAACPCGRSAHYLTYFPTVQAMQAFSEELARHMHNVDLSTQMVRLSPPEVARAAHSLGGLFVVAHAFTPHKSLYGTCAPRMSDVFKGEEHSTVAAVELGLSADADMADRIGELSEFTFLSNSDAHSLPKIGREYNLVRLAAPSFEEVALALARRDGRGVMANFGLNPKLGKYHVSACEDCGHRFRAAHSPAGIYACPECGSLRVTRGVSDRIDEIADTPEPVHPSHRPPYRYQIPLEFVPGVGPKTISRLIEAFGTEMAVIHRAQEKDLADLVGEAIAHRIVLAREGMLHIEAGGGGVYGRAILD